MPNLFQRASFDALNFYLPTADYVTQDMLSVSEIRDKGKGPYTEISTLLSEYLVIQVQESIKSYNFCCMPWQTWVEMQLIFFDNYLYTCDTPGWSERADLLSK